MINIIYPDIRVRMTRVHQDMERHHGLKMRACQMLRTVKEQNEIYAQGRTTPGAIVTRAKGGESFHNYGCAFDSCFVGHDPWMDRSPNYWDEYGRFVKAHGLRWGGDFISKKTGLPTPDRPHAEHTYGLTLADIQALYKHGKIPAVWAKFDQIRGVPEASEWKDLTDKLLMYST